MVSCLRKALYEKTIYWKKVASERLPMLNIYFCGSIRGGREMAVAYQLIITLLQKYGKVLTEHLGNDRKIERKDRALSDREIHDRDLDWIRQSELVVAEVTIPSLGVGYEIGRAVSMKKPVLCLFDARSDRTLSAMIAGGDGVKNCAYQDWEQLDKAVKEFMDLHAPHRIS
jgi:hypothetical protein